MRPPRNEPVQCARCLNRFNPDTDMHYIHRWREEPLLESERNDFGGTRSAGVFLCPSCHRDFRAFVELDREMARGPGSSV